MIEGLGEKGERSLGLIVGLGDDDRSLLRLTEDVMGLTAVDGC